MSKGSDALADQTGRVTARVDLSRQFVYRDFDGSGCLSTRLEMNLSAMNIIAARTSPLFCGVILGVISILEKLTGISSTCQCEELPILRSPARPAWEH
jgi:hypothetical protein